MLLLICSALFFGAWSAAPAPTALDLSFNSDYTAYTVTVNDDTWFESGTTYFRNAGHEASISTPKMTSYQGSDNFGEYSATELTYTDANDGTTTFLNTFKVYTDRTDVIVFTQTFPQGVANSAVGSTSNELISSFPSFLIQSGTVDVPSDLGFIHFSGSMAGSSSQYGTWAENKASSLSGGISVSGVLSIFDQNMTTTCILSPLDNFMAHDTHHDTSKETFRFGLLGNITSLPSEYSISFVLVGRNGGVNSGMRHWGRYMLDYYNKDRENSWNRDYTLQYLGYSTDNGAYYYYNTEEGKNYQDTMLDLYNFTSSINLPIRYILYDSWWYYKGMNNGVSNWTSMPSIFPDGLEYMYQQTGWKVQAHNRYFSLDTVYASNAPYTPASGYDGQTFVFEFGPDNGVPSNIDFWNYLFEMNNKWGMVVYEQDWLSTVTSEMPIFSNNATFGRQWLLEMGYGALNHDLSIQYCMSYMRHCLTSLELNSVTNARASGDYHPSNTQWKLPFSALFLSSIGMAPSKDDFWTTQSPQYQPHYSTKTNVTELYPRLEAVMATLSNGPVQPSDQIGYMNRTLIMMSCNDEGLLLRPDISATCIDNYYLDKAFGTSYGVQGELYTTYSTIGEWTYSYIMAAQMSQDYVFTLSDISHHFDETNDNFNEFLVFEANTTTKFMTFDNDNPIDIAKQNNLWDFVYYTVVPIDTTISKGWYLQGELNKWIGASNQRFESIDINSNSLRIQLVGSENETVYIAFVNYSTLKQQIVSCMFTETLTITMTCNEDSNGDLDCTCNSF